MADSSPTANTYSLSASTEEQMLIDASCQSDKQVVQQLWSNVFIQNHISYQIYDAIVQHGAGTTHDLFDQASVYICMCKA
jgi:hypothetical protein